MENAKPLLVFPEPELVHRPPGHGGGSDPPKPDDSLGRAARISKQFEKIISYIQDLPGDPSQVLVIETIGKTADFHKAVQKIDGLEWLSEIDMDEIYLGDSYASGSEDFKTAEKKGGRLYLSSSNQAALQSLLGLWQQWKENQPLPRGYRPWKYFFTYIAELRLWNEKDRLETTGILEVWKQDIAVKQGSSSDCTFEVELHFRKDEKTANNIEARLKAHVESLEGRTNSRCRIEDIGFHALKVILPVSAIENVFDAYNDHSGYPEWIKFEGIKYCRPVGQQLPGDIEPDDKALGLSVDVPDDSPPVLALFDGVPLLNHQLLENYLVFDDPDGFSEHYEPREQKHGTGMASLICHADLLNTERNSINRKIYVRPVMYPDNSPDRTEKVPDLEFVEDLIERAVTRIFDGDGVGEPVCPTIRAINLSIGNLNQPFIREMSPWAKLLDWLSWKYQILFIVSAGNYCDRILIEGYSERLSTVEENFIRGIAANQANRKLLSPAESINSLTVGSIHFDHSGNGPDNLLDPYENQRFPAEYSRNGPGYRNQVKPEILVPGGRMLYRKIKNNEYIQQPRNDVGQKMAYVGALPENITNTTHRAGTSNAAALASHAAVHLFGVLENLRQENQTLPEDYDALLLKALLVHGASWGDMKTGYQILKTPQNSRRFKRVTATHLGYGEADFERVMSCTEKRVTLLGFGELNETERHRFYLHIPDSFGGLHIRLTSTLAWFTPVNPFRYGIRQAKLFFEVPGFANGNRQEADYQQVRNGTVQHEIFEITRFEGDRIEIFIECAADAIETLESSIPYAISFTLEAMAETGIDLYSAIRQSIAIRS